MAKQKQKWTPEEEEALSAGVDKYGQGKWKIILSDPQFAIPLSNRSNIDLKDKWRNISSRLEGVATSSRIISSPKPLSTVHLLEYGDTAEPSRSSVDRTDIDSIYEPLCVGDQSGDDAEMQVDGSRYKITDQSNRAKRSRKSIRDTCNEEQTPTPAVTKKAPKPVAKKRGQKSSSPKPCVVKNASEPFATPLATATEKGLFRTTDVKEKASSAIPLDIEKAPETSLDRKKTPEVSRSPKKLSTKKARKSSSLDPCAMKRGLEAFETRGVTEKAPPEASTTSLATRNTQEISPKPFATKTRRKRSQRRRARKWASPINFAFTTPGKETDLARETLEDATNYAAYAVSVADNMEYEAIEAVEKAERMTKFLEESTVMLHVIQELYMTVNGN